MRCPGCGAENPDHVYFCGICAKELKTFHPKANTTLSPCPVECRIQLFNRYSIIGSVIGFIGFVTGFIARRIRTTDNIAIFGLYLLALLLLAVGLFYTSKARRIAREYLPT